MSKKILIIEDEKDILALAIVRLKHSGYEVISAEDAEQALGILQNNIPDLILLDLFLPKMQGDELCKKIKSDNKLKKIPIIIFTAGAASTDFLNKLNAMGADDFIFKPYESQELLNKIKKFIG